MTSSPFFNEIEFKGAGIHSILLLVESVDYLTADGKLHSSNALAAPPLHWS
jgi:hypothetical protein